MSSPIEFLTTLYCSWQQANDVEVITPEAWMRKCCTDIAGELDGLVADAIAEGDIAVNSNTFSGFEMDTSGGQCLFKGVRDNGDKVTLFNMCDCPCFTEGVPPSQTEKYVFRYSGVADDLVVPAWACEARIQVWGAGGGPTGTTNPALFIDGGAGGYTDVVLPVAELPAILGILVGQAGYLASAGTGYSAVGFGGETADGSSGGGGGSFVYNASGGAFEADDQARILVAAGGGGGAYSDGATGVKGGSGNAVNSGGELTSLGGTVDGGGGGYLGGVGGTTPKGGSGFADAGATSQSVSAAAYGTNYPPGTGEPNYEDLVGTSAVATLADDGTGEYNTQGHGLVVITFRNPCL